LDLPSGRSINLFFYDGPISRAVAFERLLDNGEDFARRLLTSFSDQRDWPQLAHIATDGETYGHHHRYGDMALSYALGYIEANDLARITNYAEYLALHPPAHTVEIFENTAWSCVHGVGRWSTNCGCNSGAHGGWNQEWRAPLRAALDWLRDQVAPAYEKAASRYLKDPWAARNDYIDVILDRSPESRERFGVRHFRRKNLQRAERVLVWKLLELQRHAMLMYTSCGWFFDELSGIETVQVIQYAGRVVQLAQELFDDSIERKFLEKLALAKSNVPEQRDGANIYAKFVKPAMVDLLRLGAHYAISSLFEHVPENARVEVDSKEYRVKRSGKMRLALGRARFTSRIAQESEMLMFGVVHFGDHNLHGGVSLYSNDEAYRDLMKAIRDAFARSDVPDTIHLIDQSFGGHTYSLRQLFRDEQRKVVNEILKPALRGIESAYRQLYDNHAPLLRFMHDCHIPVPAPMRITAEIALNGMLRPALESGELNLELIQSLFEDVRLAGAALDETTLEMALRRHLERSAQHFFENPLELEHLRKLREQVMSAKSIPLPLVLWSLQNLCYDILEKVYPEMLEKGETEWAVEFRQLAELLALKI
jgi:alpha-amylase/alpha-mannosidase (GH57 family)